MAIGVGRADRSVLLKQKFYLQMTVTFFRDDLLIFWVREEIVENEDSETKPNLAARRHLFSHIPGKRLDFCGYNCFKSDPKPIRFRFNLYIPYQKPQAVTDSRSLTKNVVATGLRPSHTYLPLSCVPCCYLILFYKLVNKMDIKKTSPFSSGNETLRLKVAVCATNVEVDNVKSTANGSASCHCFLGDIHFCIKLLGIGHSEHKASGCIEWHLPFHQQQPLPPSQPP